MSKVCYWFENKSKTVETIDLLINQKRTDKRKKKPNLITLTKRLQLSIVQIPELKCHKVITKSQRTFQVSSEGHGTN